MNRINHPDHSGINRINRITQDSRETDQTDHHPLGVIRVIRCPEVIRSEDGEKVACYVSEVAAAIARRAALVAHCRHDWRECVRVLVEAKEIEGWSGRGA